jgi:hypothetical protein
VCVRVCVCVCVCVCVRVCASVRAFARASAAIIVLLLALLQALHQCPVAVAEFEIGPAYDRGVPVAKFIPVADSAVFLRASRRSDGSVVLDSDNNAGICEGNYAFV